MKKGIVSVQKLRQALLTNSHYIQYKCIANDLTIEIDSNEFAIKMKTNDFAIESHCKLFYNRNSFILEYYL